jgi:hypothetical protein
VESKYNPVSFVKILTIILERVATNTKYISYRFESCPDYKIGYKRIDKIVLQQTGLVSS